MRGEVIAIATAINWGAENIGFAIAIDSARDSIEQAISNPLAPVVTTNIDTADVDIWHSAAFTPDGTYVTFGDEYFGEPKEPFGALWTYAVADPSVALSHYRIPRDEPSTVIFDRGGLDPSDVRYRSNR